MRQKQFTIFDNDVQIDTNLLLSRKKYEGEIIGLFCREKNIIIIEQRIEKK